MGNITSTHVPPHEDWKKMRYEEDPVPDEVLVAAPGFGYFKPSVIEDLTTTTNKFAESIGVDLSNYTYAETDQFKCTIMQGHWQYLLPTLNNSKQKICTPMWDSAACLPPTEAGNQAVFPCMTMFDGVYYDTQFNASRWCLEDGSWDSMTNYNDCAVNVLPVQTGQNNSSIVFYEELSMKTYYTGYSLSVLSLLIAVGIFLSFRELQYTRHKIHIGLFVTFLLDISAWVASAQLQNLYVENVSTIWYWCASLVLLRYFHLATFFWMFLEGLVLFLQVQLPYTLKKHKVWHFVSFGFGCPLFVTTVWSLLRIFIEEKPSGQSGWMIDEQMWSCPFFSKRQFLDIVSYMVPVFIILACNIIFLVWIMVIVINKLKNGSVMERDQNHWKATRALLVLIPLLGINYILVLLDVDAKVNLAAHNAIKVARAILFSTQGFVITLPYCFLNHEVRACLNNRWTRYQVVKSAGLETKRSSLCSGPRSRTTSKTYNQNIRTSELSEPLEQSRLSTISQI